MVNFDKEYVLRTTLQHMLKAVSRSIEKTTNRFPEFANDTVKSKEIFITIAELNSIRNNLTKQIKGL